MNYQFGSKNKRSKLCLAVINKGGPETFYFDGEPDRLPHVGYLQLE